MKKLVLGCLLLGSFGVHAEEEIVITGVPLPTQNFSSLSSGVVSPPAYITMYSTTYTPATHAAQQAAQAAGKQAAKKACLKDSQEKYNNASSDAIQRMAVSVADCHFSLSHEPDSMAACSKQASDHYDAGMVGIDDDKDLRDEYCAKTYGN